MYTKNETIGPVHVSKWLVSTSSQPSIESMLEHHLPKPPTSFEIDTWVNYDQRRRAYLDAAAKKKMTIF